MCALARDGVEGYGRRQHSNRGQVKMQPPTRITSEGGAERPWLANGPSKAALHSIPSLLRLRIVGSGSLREIRIEAVKPGKSGKHHEVGRRRRRRSCLWTVFGCLRLPSRLTSRVDVSPAGVHFRTSNHLVSWQSESTGWRCRGIACSIFTSSVFASDQTNTGQGKEDTDTNEMALTLPPRALIKGPLRAPQPLPAAVS